MAELFLSSSVLIAAIALLRLLLKNRVSARLIYALWLVAALRLMLPIQLALTYPGRCRSGVAKMDFTRAFSLDFMPLERGQYPMYDLALECGRRGGIMPTVLNAASEIAVGAFLRDAIGFTDIYEISADVVAATPYARAESYSQLCEADGAARRLAARHIKGV